MRRINLRDLVPQDYRRRFAQWLTQDTGMGTLPRNVSRHHLKQDTYRLGNTRKRGSAGWVEVKVGENGRSQVMPISEEIIEQLPAATETFVDRGVLDLIRMRLSDMITQDEGHHPA